MQYLMKTVVSLRACLGCKPAAEWLETLQTAYCILYALYERAIQNSIVCYSGQTVGC